ncbi:MAG: response regulator [Archaeoglobaceae archaeon]
MTAKILIVEDESIVAMDISSMLENLGYTVSGIAGSGEEAIRSAGIREPDLVLMDIMLRGGVDGIEAAEYIRHNFQIPVVYLTAYSDNKTLERAKITEPYGYILKPFEERELHTCIEISLYKHRMEEKLRKSEEWFSTTLKSIGEAVIATDTDGRITYMNPVAQELTGWNTDRALNHMIEEIYTVKDEESGEVIENPVISAVEDRMVFNQSGNRLLIAVDGKEIPIDYNAAPIIDDRGNCEGGVLTFKDISERRKAEEIIEQRLEFEKTIADVSSQFIGIFDIDRATNYALKKMGELSGASDASLFLFKENTVEKTNEWRRSEFKKLKPKSFRPQKMPWLMEKIKKGDLVYVHDVERLPHGAEAEKEMFNQLEIKSIIGLPVYVREKPEGFVCFDYVRNIVSDVEWSEEDLALLKVFSEILGNALERKRAEEELQRQVDRLQKSMKDTVSAISRIYMNISSKPSRWGKNPGL